MIENKGVHSLYPEAMLPFIMLVLFADHPPTPQTTKQNSQDHEKPHKTITQKAPKTKNQIHGEPNSRPQKHKTPPNHTKRSTKHPSKTNSKRYKKPLKTKTTYPKTQTSNPTPTPTYPPTHTLEITLAKTSRNLTLKNIFFVFTMYPFCTSPFHPLPLAQDYT